MNTKRFISVKSAAARILAFVMVAVVALSAASPAYAAATVHVSSVGVGTPTGSVTYGTAGSVNYPVTVVCAGTGNGIMVTPGISGSVPTGVSGSFSPSTLTWGNGCSGTNPQITTLTLQTTASTPGGVASFSVAVGGASGSGSLTVHGIALTVQGLVVDNKVYDGNANATISAYGALSTGVISPDSVSLDHSGAGATFSDKFVGSGKTVTAYGFTLTGAQASNYTLTQPTTFANISKAPLHIFIDASGADKIYDGNTNAAVTLSTDKVLGDSVSVSGTGSFDNKNVGINKTVSASGVSIFGSDAGNYNIDLSTGTGLADISARALTVTAGPDTKQYDGTTNSSIIPAITSGTLVGGDTAGFNQSFDSANVGTGKTLAVSGSVSDGNSGNNYAVSFVSATGAIQLRPVTVTAGAKSKVYGESDPELTYGITSGTLASGDAFTGGISRAAGENVGSYAITQGSLALGSNYNLSFVGANLNITARPISSVIADSKTIGFGDPDPVFTFSYGAGDLASGDTAADIDSAPVCGISGNHSAAGSYPIVCSGGSDPNYNFGATSYINGTLTRSAAPITISTDQFSSNALYDGWILESGEFTNTGGTMNAKSAGLRVGDDALNNQYKSLLAFDTSNLPNSLTIQQVTLKVRLQKFVGGNKVFTSLKGLLVDINKPFFGKKLTLQLGDFKFKPTAAVGMLAAGSLPTNSPDSLGWYSINVNPAAFQYVNLDGTTQLRLRFAKDDNNNLIANYLSLYSGNSADAPQLVITYSVP